MFGAIAGGIASALAGGAMSKLFGGGQKAASGGIQGDVLATDNNTVDRKSGSAGMPRPISYAVFCWKKKRNKCRHGRARGVRSPLLEGSLSRRSLRHAGSPSRAHV